MIKKQTRTVNRDQGSIRLINTQGQLSPRAIYYMMKVVYKYLGMSMAKWQK